MDDSQIDHTNLSPHAAGEDVDGGASLQVVRHHLARDFLGIGTHSLRRHAMIGGENGDERRVAARSVGTLNGRELAADLK
ncbi:MAG: hypothetical protein NVSMB9_01750 [Isosphaeraceae bacterium]